MSDDLQALTQQLLENWASSGNSDTTRSSYKLITSFYDEHICVIIQRKGDKGTEAQSDWFPYSSTDSIVRKKETLMIAMMNLSEVTMRRVHHKLVNMVDQLEIHRHDYELPGQERPRD